MSTKPILFSTPMVQAILDGRKTMTRRVIKPQPDCPYVGFDNWRDSPKNAERLGKIRKTPCAPGDVLWVRETWQSFFPEEVTPQHQQGPRSRAGVPAESAKGHYMHYYYRADGEIEDAPEYGTTHYGKANWMSPIHMPKAAARIFLRVTDVRVERVQDIGADDAYAEGYHETEPIEHRPRSWFSSVWDSLNAKRGYGWDSNPWVWVYSFERVDKPAGWPGGEGGE